MKKIHYYLQFTIYGLLILQAVALPAFNSTLVSIDCPKACDCPDGSNTTAICSLESVHRMIQNTPCLPVFITSLKITPSPLNFETALEHFWTWLPNCLPRLEHLDVSNMNLTSSYVFDDWICQFLLFTRQEIRLESFNLTGNQLSQFSIKNCSAPLHFPNLKSQLISFKKLDLSNNVIKSLSLSDLINGFQGLRFLDVSHNPNIEFDLNPVGQRNISLHLVVQGFNVSELMPNMFPLIPDLHILDLSYSMKLSKIQKTAFASFPNLAWLYLAHLPILIEVTTTSFSKDIPQLKFLDISYSPNLSTLDVADSTNLTTLHLLDTPLVSLQLPFRQLIDLQLGSSSRWNCTCDILWITAHLYPNRWFPNSKIPINSNETVDALDVPEMFSNNQPRCASPAHLKGQLLPVKLPECQEPRLSNCTIDAFKKLRLSQEVILTCVADGLPAPDIHWYTPSGEIFVFRHHQRHRYQSLNDIQNRLWHLSHIWHDNDEYLFDLGRNRFYLLGNSPSLFIDYLTREDPGIYVIVGINPLGNVTHQLELHLDPSVLYAIRANSLFVGLFCAVAMLICGILTGVNRHISSHCSPEEREKRRSLRQLIALIETYRVGKADKFRAYRHHHLDRLKGNYTVQVCRIKESCSTYTAAVQENYCRRVTIISENCEARIDRLRESYKTKCVKMKGYKWSQMARLRDSYQQKINKIREFSTWQMDRVREQYKVHQQHMAKLAQLLQIENTAELVAGAEQLDNICPILKGLEELDTLDEDLFPDDFGEIEMEIGSLVDSEDFMTACSDSDTEINQRLKDLEDEEVNLKGTDSDEEHTDIPELDTALPEINTRLDTIDSVHLDTIDSIHQRKKQLTSAECKV